MDRIKALEIFSAIVEHDGFTRGANAMDISTSVVTRVIQKLESELGARLFARTTRKVTLTPFGRSFLDQASAVIGSYEALALMGKQNAGDASGRVRLDAPALFGLQRLGGLVAGFVKENPTISVDIRTNDGAADALGGLADVAISVDRPIPESVIARPLMQLRTGLYASRDYIARYGTPRHPQDLPFASCMGLPCQGDHGGYEVWNRVTNSRFVIAKSCALAADSAEALIGAATQGVGVVLVPTLLAQQAHLIPLLPDWRPNALQVHLLYRPRKLEPVRIRKLIEFLTEELAQPMAADTIETATNERSTPYPFGATTARTLVAA